MFFNVSLARRATAILVLASILLTPIQSHGYDVPKRNEAPINPVEEQIRNLLPGNWMFPVEHCEIGYTICQFGKESPTYIQEMQIRAAIIQKQGEVNDATSENPLNEEKIDRRLDELNKLIKDLQNLIEKRPVPHSSDPCLIKYRQCLLEEHRNPPPEEGGF